jgi:formate-dependent phosphoribosylglycinamide formyltransferase (GAR transformylase)
MKKKVLLLGSSFSAMSLLDRLKKRGYYVAVCGNQVDDPCHSYADASFYCDYANTETVRNILKQSDFNYLVPSCNDIAYMTATALAQAYGFVGYDTLDTANILHKKHSFRAFTSLHKMPVPAYQKLDSAKLNNALALTLPVLVKPVDSFSGRGVTRVDSAQALLPAIADAAASSHTAEVIVESFIEGSLHSHSAFIENQTICFDTFVDEFCTVYPYQVNCSNHPSALTLEIQTQMRSHMSRLIQLLNLNDGLLHTQFMVANNHVWIIECMRRCPGDLFGHLVEMSNGLDYMDLYLRPFLGESIMHDSSYVTDAPKWISRHTISVDRALAYYSVSYQIPSKSTRYVSLKNSGEPLKPAPYDKLGIVFAEHDSQAQMLEVTPKLHEMININPHEGLA